jgi:hypothetical protein
MRREIDILTKKLEDATGSKGQYVVPAIVGLLAGWVGRGMKDRTGAF